MDMIGVGPAQGFLLPVGQGAGEAASPRPRLQIRIIQKGKVGDISLQDLICQHLLYSFCYPAVIHMAEGVKDVQVQDFPRPGALVKDLTGIGSQENIDYPRPFWFYGMEAAA
jgi:hypothetical protein